MYDTRFTTVCVLMVRIPRNTVPTRLASYGVHGTNMIKKAEDELESCSAENGLSRPKQLKYGMVG